MSINRRTFLVSGGALSISALVPGVSALTPASTGLDPFQWKTDNLIFSFDVAAGRLRQKRLVPASEAIGDHSSGVEVALQCSGENSPDQGMKSGMGQPGIRLLFAGHEQQSSARGERLVCTH